MFSLGTVSSCSFFSPCSFGDLRFPVFPFVVSGRKRMGRDGGLVFVNRVVGTEMCSVLGVCDLKRSDYVCGFVRRCRRDWDSEGDLALEAELLEFMKNSENPDVFPSKRQLIDAGRLDLVNAIAKQGGWLSLGWDLDDENEQEEENLDDENEQDEENLDDENEQDEEKEVRGIIGVGAWDLTMTTECDNGASLPATSSLSINSSHSASSSGRSLENTEDDSGIEGILSRLEKERNINFGFGLREKGNNAHRQSNNGKDVGPVGNSTDATVFGLKRNNIPASLSSNKGIINYSGATFDQKRSLSNINSLSNSLKPDAWRTWSIQKACSSDEEFEAGEISLDETNMGRQKEMNPYDEVISHNQLRSRIQNLELELSSLLHSIRSKADEAALQEGHEKSSEDLQKLHDAWEFQENEIMSAQNRLRSIRAKLAVLEGKMALAIIDAQKVVEEKQKSINDAQRAFRLLRTACIVWPNSASEVKLAGSFDGWATQREMQKSSTGIFSVSLKLYPGRYEIKFIVDEEWKIDPLRPIVHNGGHQNNLLIIT